MSDFLVVGRGLLGTTLKTNGKFDVIGHREFWDVPLKRSYKGYVCAAALSSDPICQAHTMKEIIKANVELPLEMLKEARNIGAPFIALSTSGLYRQPGFRSEEDDTEPHNRYTTSKIIMEYVLNFEDYDKCYIFRTPFMCFFSSHYNDMESRVRRWEKCDAVETSMLYKDTIIGAVIATLESTPPQGIYNMASEVVLLSDFVKSNFDYKGEIVPAHSLGRTPSTCLDLTKAQEAGIIS